MTCVTCHDPHEGFREAGPDYFNATCLSCHAVAGLQARVAPAVEAAHTEAANCYSCHMPRADARDAPHASFTDHWIRVGNGKAEAVDLPDPITAHTAPELVPHFERDADGPESQRYQGMAYLIYGEQKGNDASVTRGIHLLEETLNPISDSGGEGHFLLGRALLQRGKVRQAIPILEAALELKPDIPERLNALARAYEADRRNGSQVGDLYERILTIQPALSEIRVSYGRFLNEQNQLPAAIEQYRRATAEQPWLVSGHYNLGTALLQRGDISEASRALEQAVTLEPDYADALVNLAGARIIQQRFVEAIDLLERAVALEPGNVAALGNLGLMYAQMGRYDEARQRLLDVLRITPGDARAQAALAQVNQLLNNSL